MKQAAYFLLISFGLLAGSCSLFGNELSKTLITNVDEIVAPPEASANSQIVIFIRFTHRCTLVDRVEEMRSENVITFNIFVIDEEESCTPQPAQFEVRRVLNLATAGEYTLASGDKTKSIIIR